MHIILLSIVLILAFMIFLWAIITNSESSRSLKKTKVIYLYSSCCGWDKVNLNGLELANTYKIDVMEIVPVDVGELYNTKKTLETLYDRGYRYFTGLSSSTQLIQAGDFFQMHPDAVRLSVINSISYDF